MNQVDLVVDALSRAGHSNIYGIKSHVLSPAPNAFNVTVAALLEVNRADLTRVLQPMVDDAYTPSNRAFRAILPHFDRSWFAGTLSLDELALVEKAMSIGYQAIGAKYSCPACEWTFEDYGLSHRPDFANSTGVR